jgi:hypothetical protein
LHCGDDQFVIAVLELSLATRVVGTTICTSSPARAMCGSPSQ